MNSAAPVGASLAYSVCSIGMVLVNKVVLSTYGLTYSMSLLLFQSACTAALVYGMKVSGTVPVDDFRWSTARAWLPVNLLFLAMLYTGYMSLRLLAVPMVTIFKNLTNVLILGGDWYWFSQHVSPKVLLSLGLTILGAVAAAGVDTRFSATGYAWMAANCAATAGYVLYMRAVTRTTKLTEFGGSFYNNVIALPLTAAAAIAAGEFPGVLQMPQWSSPGFVLSLLLSGVIGFAISICSLWCLKATSASTYAIIGALNKVPLAVIGVIAFADPLTLKLAAYIALGLGAGVMYAMAKVRCTRLFRCTLHHGQAQVEEREAARARERAAEDVRDLEHAAGLERVSGHRVAGPQAGGGVAGGDAEEDAAMRRPLALPQKAQ